jgi:hypothetical protein
MLRNVLMDADGREMSVERWGQNECTPVVKQAKALRGAQNHLSGLK